MDPGLTRLSGEGRLMDLDPTIGGSLSEFGKETHERSEQARHCRGEIEADRGGGGLLEQVVEAVHGFPPGLVSAERRGGRRRRRGQKISGELSHSHSRRWTETGDGGGEFPSVEGGREGEKGRRGASRVDVHPVYYYYY